MTRDVLVPDDDPRTATHAQQGVGNLLLSGRQDTTGGAVGSGLDAVAWLMADALEQLLAEHDVVR